MLFSKAHTLSLVTILFVASLCSAQVKTNLPGGKPGNANMITVQSKLVKTQGSKESDNVHCSLQDKSGMLWFGTTGEGVYQYDGKSFTQFTTSNGLNSNTVWCILEDKDGQIWIGTATGICRYTGRGFTAFPIDLLPGIDWRPGAVQNNAPASKYDVWSIMQDKAGKIWFATTDGVYCYNGQSFTRFPDNSNANGFHGNKVEYIVEDKAGNYWFGGRGIQGVFRYDGKSFTQLKPNGDNWAWPVLQDKQSYIWFSNWQGAYRYDGQSFTRFTKNEGLSSGVITRIIEDKAGSLWFGCLNTDGNLGMGSSGGICRLDDASFTRFSREDGLVNNDIWTILEAEDGAVWIGSRGTGLCRYDGKNFIKLSE